MKHIFAAVLFVPCAALLFSQGAPRLGDITAVMAGLSHALSLSEYSDEESGGNFDSSLRWEKKYVTSEAPADPDRLRGQHKPAPVKDTESVSFVFDGYGFYLSENTGGRHQKAHPVITIDGNLTALSENRTFTGTLAARGTDSVRTVEFNGFQFAGKQGSARVNGQEYDGETLRDVLNDTVEWLDAAIIDADTESGIVFFVCFMAMLTTDIGAQFDELGDAAQNEVPAGITAANPEKTLTLTTQKNQFTMMFTDFTLSELYAMSGFSHNPQINGAFTMDINVTEYDIESITYNGKIDVRNMVFITSLEFDACTMSNNMKEFDGTIAVNGKPKPLSQFVNALKSAEPLL